MCTEANTVDVRGLRVHEAEAAVEERLRGANGPVWVIHGIGTGKLKRGLREWLEAVRQLHRLPPAGQLGAQPRCFPGGPRSLGGSQRLLTQRRPPLQLAAGAGLSPACAAKPGPPPTALQLLQHGAA